MWHRCNLNITIHKTFKSFSLRYLRLLSCLITHVHFGIVTVLSLYLTFNVIRSEIQILKTFHFKRLLGISKVYMEILYLSNQILRYNNFWEIFNVSSIDKKLFNVTVFTLILFESIAYYFVLSRFLQWRIFIMKLEV